MARRLNIERRRKRIRHYRAQRRRRSPAWRALLFWWAPALIVAVAALALAQAVAAFVGRPGAGPAARYALPRPSLGLVAATAAQAEELRRLGNVRRLAGAGRTGPGGRPMKIMDKLKNFLFPPLQTERIKLK